MHCLHASECVACCELRGQAGFLPLHTGHHLRDERCDTSCGSASRLPGRGSKEAMERTGEPLAPLWFQGFRLHSVWSQLPGGEPVRQIAFSHLREDATTPMLEYEPEKFPQSLLQGSKMLINLWPPSHEHWNIESDLILTLTMDTYQQRCEAKRVEQDPEQESVGAEASPKRYLFQRRLLRLWLVAARLHPQQRPHTREKEIWRPRLASLNAFMPPPPDST